MSLEFVSDDHDMVGMISTELCVIVSAAPAHEAKDRYLETYLEKRFGSYDWARSFTKKQILVCGDIVPSEILIVLHRWLRKKCADIENIMLVNYTSTGIADWWKNWCAVNQERSFSIKEIFWTSCPERHVGLFQDIPPLPDKKFFLDNKHVTKLFGFYGGTYTSHEREYLVLKMMKYRDQAAIDFMAEFSSKQSLLDYIEEISYFKNQTEVDYISQMFDQHLVSGKLVQNLQLMSQQPMRDEKFKLDGYQWQIDKMCWATVIRETINSDKFSYVTEKTIRAFLHHCVAIPIGYKSVACLEDQGFWFPHDLIDYSYQFEDLFVNRVNRLVAALDDLSKIPIPVLQQYYVDNIDKFHYNAQVVYDRIKNMSQLERECIELFQNYTAEI